jgi:hypothetical protein
MIADRFLDRDEVVAWLSKDRDRDEGDDKA